VTSILFINLVFVRNDNVCSITKQPPLSSTVKSECLLLFGHVTHANRMLFKLPLEYWRKPTGWPHFTWLKNVTDKLMSFDTGLPEARDAAQNQSA